MGVLYYICSSGMSSIYISTTYFLNKTETTVGNTKLVGCYNFMA